MRVRFYLSAGLWLGLAGRRFLGFICLDVLKELQNVDADSFCDDREHSRADAVHSCLVFLQLLMTCADLIGQILQRHPCVQSKLPELTADSNVDIVR
jgi:hypothetical protein